MPAYLSFAALDDTEMRHLAIMADAVLAIESARIYGFIQGGAVANVERSEDAIAAARERGLTWTEEERNEVAVHLIQQWNDSQGESS